MTISDMRCDRCGTGLSGLARDPHEDPLGGVRFTYHPGDPALRDDSGVLCERCWSGWTTTFGAPQQRVCATCGTAVRRRASLFVRQLDWQTGWQFCTAHAVELLNGLRTVTPKLDPATFRLPLDTPQESG
jgi:hypothetical protein